MTTNATLEAQRPLAGASGPQGTTGQPLQSERDIQAGTGPSVSPGPGAGEAAVSAHRGGTARELLRSCGGCLSLLRLPWSKKSPTAPAILLQPTTGPQTPHSRSVMETLTLQIDGHATDVVTQICKPEGPGPFPLVIFSHGFLHNSANMQRVVGPRVADYWLDQGVAVVAPFRPGYGPTGGPPREGPFRMEAGSRVLDVARQARKVRDVLVQVHAWAREQSWANPDRILLVGQSLGGFGSIAAAELELPGVVGIVNFAGGSRAGAPRELPCADPRALEQAYAEFGQRATRPSLWLYAQNDSTYDVNDPPRWHAAFQAGGSDARFVQAPPLEGHDGHLLLRVGMEHWTPEVTGFMRDVSFLP